MKRASVAFFIVLGLVGLFPFLLSAHGPATPPTQLTFNTVIDGNPVISANGLKVAFVEEVGGNFQVFVVNSDGSGRLQLTSNNANHTSLSISANGGKVTFQSDTGNDRDIWMVNSDGSGSVALASGPADELDPAISGDGLWVAFVSYASSYQNCPTCNNTGGDPEIFEIKTDRTSLRQVTSNTKNEFSPSVSSSGGKIAFQSNIPGTYEIFVINSDGTGLTQISSSSGDYTASSPSISTDGSKIAYDSNAPAQSILNLMTIRPEPLTSYEVYVANSNGGSLPVQVSTTGGDNFTPSLSGDGSKVAYVSTGDGDREVYLANSDGTSQPTRVTDNTAYDAEPSTDSDGDSIVFSSNIDGDFEIFISHIVTPTVHDVAVTGITVLRRIGYNTIAANPLKVNVTVMNQGTASETISVEIYFLNGPTLSSQATTISPGANKTLTFGIVTQSLAVGSYTLAARAVPVPGEADTSDNTQQDGNIQVRIPGDVDGDRDVDILDAATLAFYYGGTCATPGRYLDAADLDNHCDIDILDAATLAFYYGTTG